MKFNHKEAILGTLVLFLMLLIVLMFAFGLVFLATNNHEVIAGIIFFLTIFSGAYYLMGYSCEQ